MFNFIAELKDGHTHTEKEQKYKIIHIVNSLSCHLYLRNHTFHKLSKGGDSDLSIYIGD